MLATVEFLRQEALWGRGWWSGAAAAVLAIAFRLILGRVCSGLIAVLAFPLSGLVLRLVGRAEPILSTAVGFDRSPSPAR